MLYRFAPTALRASVSRKVIRSRRPNAVRTMSAPAAATSAPGTFDQGLNAVSKDWYTELSELWPGQGMSYKIKEILFQGKSDFQDVCVFESEAYGTVLVLDGAVQCTDRDEFAYQELMAHLPMCALKEPGKRALVVGGGDGGVLRELSRHASLEEIHIAELDKMVIDVSKKYFPQMAVGFSDPRVQVHITDGIKYVVDAPENHFDVIVVDSSDPIGPAQVLFEKPFYEAMHRALKPGGCICTQGESVWLHLDIIKELAGMCAVVFKGGSVSYAYTTIPTYPSGQIGMMVCSKAAASGPPLDPRTPNQPPPDSSSSELPPLRYYSSRIHSAAFVLPKFAEDALKGHLSFQ